MPALREHSASMASSTSGERRRLRRSCALEREFLQSDFMSAILAPFWLITKGDFATSPAPPLYRTPRTCAARKCYAVPPFAVASLLRAPVPPGQRVGALACRHLRCADLPGPAKNRRACAEQSAPLQLFFLPILRRLVCPYASPTHLFLVVFPCGLLPCFSLFGAAAARHRAAPGFASLRPLTRRAARPCTSLPPARSACRPGATAVPCLASRSAPGLSRCLLPCISHNAALRKRASRQGLKPRVVAHSRNGRYVLAALRANAWLFASPAPGRERHARPAQLTFVRNQRVADLWCLATRSTRGLARRALNRLSWPAPHRPPPALSRSLPFSAAGSVRHSVSHGPCSAPLGSIVWPPTRHAPAARLQGPSLPGASLPPATGARPAPAPATPVAGGLVRGWPCWRCENHPGFAVDRKN